MATFLGLTSKVTCPHTGSGDRHRGRYPSDRKLSNSQRVWGLGAPPCSSCPRRGCEMGGMWRAVGSLRWSGEGPGMGARSGRPTRGESPGIRPASSNPVVNAPPPPSETNVKADPDLGASVDCCLRFRTSMALSSRGGSGLSVHRLVRYVLGLECAVLVLHALNSTTKRTKGSECIHRRILRNIGKDLRNEIARRIEQFIEAAFVACVNRPFRSLLQIVASNLYWMLPAFLDQELDDGSF